MRIARADCPGCGAPLAVHEGQRHVICAYCDSSLRIELPAPGGPQVAVRLSDEQVPAAEIERVKQLVLDGRRGDAIAHYAAVAGLPVREAEQAVDLLIVPELGRLLRRAPVDLFYSFVLTLVIGGVTGFGVRWGVLGTLAGDLPGPAVVAAVSALLLVLHLRWLIPKLVSTYVARRGAPGHARVVKRTLLRPDYVKGGSAVLLLLEVRPATGDPAFLAEEALLVRTTSLDKLLPGNVFRVRYAEPARDRVFPVSPIEVVARE